MNLKDNKKMDNNFSGLLSFWEKEVSNHIPKYVPYRASQHLKQMCALFTPGVSYFYIFNFHNLKMDYVAPSTSEVLGITSDEFTLKKLLEIQSPGGVKAMEQKEALIADFLFRFLTPKEIPFYKIVYYMRLRHSDGKYRNILHQVTTLTVSDTGKVEHVLGIHTDTSHLNLVKNDKVSFISLNGGPSYYNLDPEEGVFDPANSSRTGAHSELFTKRELEVIKLFAEGHTAAQVGEKLCIAENTVRTHRKKILEKTDCTNMTELVASCVVEGVI